MISHRVISGEWYDTVFNWKFFSLKIFWATSHGRKIQSGQAKKRSCEWFPYIDRPPDIYYDYSQCSRQFDILKKY